MNPIKSIEARYQSLIMNNFEKTKYAKQLRLLKDIHRGQACFIIGNGPSLTAEDLEVIHKHSIPTFAFNRIYLMFDKTNWRPTYYMSQDEKTLKNCVDQVSAMDLKYKFIPINLKFYMDISIKNATYFKMNHQPANSFSSDISSFVGNSNTVAFTAAQFAAYMGFNKIYLIGVDHNFSVTVNSKGDIIRDNSVKDYFTEAYNKDKDELYIPNLDESTKAYIAMKKYCDSNNIEVYNATRGGKLEVFPRVDFDKINFEREK